MPRKRRALDTVGRPTSEEALQVRDLKGQSTKNYASDKEVCKRAGKFVSDFINQCEMNRVGLNDKLAILYALWNGDPITNYFPLARAIHVPEPFKAVEGFVPRIADILVEQVEWFRVVGIDESGKKNADKIKRLMTAQLERDQFKSKFRAFARDCAIYGYAPGKTRWKRKRRAIKFNKVEETPVKTNGVETAVEVKKTKEAEEEVILDGPTLEHVDPFDFFVDLRYRDVQDDSPGVAFRQERFEDHLLEMEKRGVYVNVRELISHEKESSSEHTVNGPPGSLMNPTTFRELRDAADGITVNMVGEKQASRTYELFEYWGRWDKDYDPLIPGKRGEEKEFVITLGRRNNDRNQRGGWIVLRIEENPYWHGQRPCVVAHFIRRSHCFQSVGIIEPIMKLCAELDESRNMALMARSLSAKPCLVVTDDADIYGTHAVLDPGTILRARNKDAITTLFMPDRSDTAYRAEEVIKMDIRETTGIISMMQGMGAEGSDTATESVNRMREANKRIAEVARNIAADFLVPLLEQFFAMNQQMLTKERAMELVGEDGITMDVERVSPAEIAGKVNFQITALPQIEMAGLEAKMIMNFLTTVQPFMASLPQYQNLVRVEELMKMAWERMFGTGAVDKIFPFASRPIEYRSTIDEHIIIGMGHELQPQEGENYLEHFNQHTRFASSDAFRQWPYDAQRRLAAHIHSTSLRLQAEVEQSAPRLPMQPGTPMPGMQQGMQPGMGPPGMPPVGVPGQGMPPQGPQMGPQQGQGPQMPGAQRMGGLTTESQVRSNIQSMAPRTSRDKF